MPPGLDRTAFIRAQTRLRSVPYVPTIALHLADEATELWQKTEDELEIIGLPPPFWAFAWAGGQALARYLLDHPEVVAGVRVLDFASGSGLVAIAAAQAGAAHVVANDIDPFALEAIALNAAANAVALEPRGRDLVGMDEGWDLVLAGDIFYERDTAVRVLDWLERLESRGARVLVGDPGRSYLDRRRLVPIATYEVPVTRSLEDTEIKRSSVWRLRPKGACARRAPAPVERKRGQPTSLTLDRESRMYAQSPATGLGHRHGQVQPADRHRCASQDHHVDTDKIIPKQYLKTIKAHWARRRSLFEMRYNDDGSLNPDFVLNKAAYQGTSILVAGDNFGCGSSREHAPWALLDFGIRCVISTSFADIFYNNCFKNGILPIVVSPENPEKLFDDAERGANARLSVDLEQQEIRGPDGGLIRFDIDPFRKHCLLEGLDDVGLTMAKEAQIDRFEAASAQSRPWAEAAVARRPPCRRESWDVTPRLRRDTAGLPGPCGGFPACLASLKGVAESQGIAGQAFDAATNGLEPGDVLHFQHEQPEFSTPIWDYLAGLVDDERVADGKEMLTKYAGALDRVEARFGVDRASLVALWGVESDFGRSFGTRPVIQSLATLACYGDKPAYFRSEFLAALTILQRGDVQPDKFNGSWAGAFGHTQFMPSTFLHTAIDMDGNGHPDIVDSIPDALGSTANYLRKSGWVPGLRWGFEVKLPAGYAGPSGRKIRRPASFWLGAASGGSMARVSIRSAKSRCCCRPA